VLCVLQLLLSIFRERLTHYLFLRFNLRLGVYAPCEVHFSNHTTICYYLSGRISTLRQNMCLRRLLEQGLGDTWELLVEVSRLLKDDLEYIPASWRFKYYWEFCLWYSGTPEDYSQRTSRLIKPTALSNKVIGACRMDIWGPTDQVVHARTEHGILRLLSDLDHDTRRCSLHGNHRTIL
jgi:hypothetical protein